MISNEVVIGYRHQAGTAKPFYVNNEEVRGVAESVRRRLLPTPDTCRVTRDRILAIETIRINGTRLDVCWSTEHPVTNEQGEPVLGVCEYDHGGVPDTALISVNPEMTGDDTGLQLGTLAHEFGHAIFDVPGWRALASQTGLPGLFSEPNHRVFRTVTADEEHLTTRKVGAEQFREWRANEFMGAMLVPFDLLADRLRYHAAVLGIPLKDATDPGLLPLGGRASPIAPEVDYTRDAFKISVLLCNLANDFGVSLRFVSVRLLRYGLATGAQLGVG